MFMVTYWYDRDSYGTSTSHRDRLNKCSFSLCVVLRPAPTASPECCRLNLTIRLEGPWMSGR